MANILLDAIGRQPIPHTPVWLMRQAGRYLPEYRKLRAQAGSFLNLCKNPDLATEVTLQPLKRFKLDAAILFSDILVIPEAMGLPLTFIEGVGPKFGYKINSQSDIDNLNNDAIPNLEYVFTAIKNCKRELDSSVPLIGFSGSPFTLACYMLEGGASKDYLSLKSFLYNNPTAMHKLLGKLSDAVSRFLQEQINAGVDLVMLFDSWGGILTADAYEEFSLSYMRKVMSTITKTKPNGVKIPKIVFVKGSMPYLGQISALDVDVIGIDWTIDIALARSIIPKNIFIQGNLDPSLLAVAADKAMIKHEVKRILDRYKRANDGSGGHIFNLGHGVLPQTPPDNVAYLVDIVHELSQT